MKNDLRLHFSFKSNRSLTITNKMRHKDVHKRFLKREIILEEQGAFCDNFMT